MPSIKPKELERLAAAGKRMYEGGLTTGTLGAIGVRLPGGSVAVTADGARLGFMKKADLLVMNGSIEPAAPGRKPGRETSIIRAVLAAQPSAGSVIRVHSPYTTALAHKGRKALEKSSALFEDLGGVAFVPYYRPGTAGLAGAVAEVMRSHQVAIIEGQGAVVWGRDVEDAIDRAEALEAAARVVFILISSNGSS
jgi:3-dehydro-4-phosphotetronate decarboxylase